MGTKDAAWRVAIGKDASDQMRLRLMGPIGDDSWQLLLTVPLQSTYEIGQSVR